MHSACIFSLPCCRPIGVAQAQTDLATVGWDDGLRGKTAPHTFRWALCRCGLGAAAMASVAATTALAVAATTLKMVCCSFRPQSLAIPALRALFSHSANRATGGWDVGPRRISASHTVGWDVSCCVCAAGGCGVSGFSRSVCYLLLGRRSALQSFIAIP